ncbi:MAG: hypothetical protein DWQ31_10070 [Planctomycetota bacterium]|nr:MAG: hypothetical protein DWQ31_10070 [Planctomycetota bacterium]REJ96868.1 MAG: hypothetical protein DWQ35_03660 [Planctomycetota bacterium]
MSSLRFSCAMVALLVGLGCVLPVALRAAPLELPRDAATRPQLQSIYSEFHDVSELVDDETRAVVFCFLGIDCPVAQQYLPRLKEMSRRYHDRGVRFYGVYPNQRAHVMRMATHAHDQDISFPVFRDEGQRLVKWLGAGVTPEVVVLDARWEKRYQGAIDDQFKKRGRRREVNEHFLADALESVLAEQPVEVTYRPPSGCPIESAGRRPPQENVTFHRDVAPLLQKHCQSCHRDGGVGPFELTTFDDAYDSAERIQMVVEERRMPPWHGYLNPKFGELNNDKRMTREEIRTIVDWIRTGAAEGDAAEAPQPVTWPAADAWEIGEPDYVYRIPPFRVPKHGILDYQFFRVRLDFTEDRWFRAVQVKPGSTDVVHHVGLHIVPANEKEFTGFAGMAELYGLNAEGAILINDYVPGDTYNAKVYPAEQAVRIPKNSDLIFELHYTPNNREAVTDRSMVGFVWTDAAPVEEVFTAVYRKPIGRFRIPPHATHHVMHDTYYFRHDVLVDAIRPHFHLRAKSFRLETVTRDELSGEITDRQTIMTVPVWDPDWQRTYELKTPLKILAGTELLATAVFDNSHFNPNNPDPAKEVEWGQQTEDEMFSVRFKYRRAETSPENPR